MARLLTVISCLFLCGALWAENPIRIKGDRFVDAQDRTLILRGVNLGGSSKAPYKPDGATYRKENFYDWKNVSFIGRPFPLSEANVHFARLQSWGLTFVRLLVPWEAVEHAGPGEYDKEYLNYLRALVKIANEHGILIFIDPHMDVWSRWTGGDGAPAWTLEAVGIDITKLFATGAAITHQEYGDPFPRMIWPSNAHKLGAATMYTLFFGGNDFAPKTKIDGIPVQEYLQSHYINAMKQVALALKDLPNVVGFDTLNEPTPGYIGNPDVTKVTSSTLHQGATPSMLQSLQAASGQTIEVDTVRLGAGKTGAVRLNPEKIRLWREGMTDLWQTNGAWDGREKVRRKDYFAQAHGRDVDFANDYLKPFWKHFMQEMKSVAPDALFFAEGDPFGTGLPQWSAADGVNLVHASHWYDGQTLMSKHFNPNRTVDPHTGKIIEGAQAVRQLFIDQLGAIKQQSETLLGGVPTLIGEFGVPFDLDDGKAYRTGEFSAQEEALHLYIDVMDHHLLSFTLWNYTADNDHEHGDQWNGEDLSIFSRTERTNKSDLDSGGRALGAVVRPYAKRIAGEPLKMFFDRKTGVFELVFRADPKVIAPTEIFVPWHQYPNDYVPKLEMTGKGRPYKIARTEDGLLRIYGGAGDVTVTVTPRPRPRRSVPENEKEIALSRDLLP